MIKSINRKILPLQLSFLIFSMLLNCMGIVILKFAGGNVSYSGLGFLESFKDLPIALVSVLSVNLINRTGTKRALLYSLLLVTVSCIVLPFFGDFWFFKIWFAVIGVGFAMAKISIFGILRNNIHTEKELSKVMNKIEAFFMIGIFCVNIGFGWLLTSKYAEMWKFGFWIIAALAIINFLLLIPADFKENSNSKAKNKIRFYKLLDPKIIGFLLIIFLIVFAEQGFNSWLPIFYKNHLKADSFLALQSGAFLALFSFAGRMITSRIISRIKWSTYIYTCLFAVCFLLIVAQIFYHYSLIQFLILLFPVLGLFLSPLYPLYNSRMLSKTDQSDVNLLVSVIVVFSSLGSSVGSLSMALVFQHGLSGYYAGFALVPVILILCTTILLQKGIVSNKEIR